MSKLVYGLNVKYTKYKKDYYVLEDSNHWYHIVWRNSKRENIIATFYGLKSKKLVIKICDDLNQEEDTRSYRESIYT